MKASELHGILSGLITQVDKVGREMTTRIDLLEKNLADADIPAAAEADIAALRKSLQTLDDVNPDLPEQPATPPVEPPPAPPADPATTPA